VQRVVEEWTDGITCDVVLRDWRVPRERSQASAAARQLTWSRQRRSEHGDRTQARIDGEPCSLPSRRGPQPTTRCRAGRRATASAAGRS
jgi:hypothetical protein